MSTFDPANPPAIPDSDLDSDLALEATFVIEDERECGIAPGDWVDVSSGYLPVDPIWGESHQVSNVYPDASAIGVLMYDPKTDSYFETTLNSALISNNFRRV